MGSDGVQVYTPSSSQEDVFKDTESLMTSVLDGFNVCIFAYGQSGTGKTFTMEGTEEMPGLVRCGLATCQQPRTPSPVPLPPGSRCASSGRCVAPLAC